MFGGKADSLLKLQEHGFNVPAFFIITSDDYRSFVKGNGILETLREAVVAKDNDRIKKIVLSGEFGPKLKEKVSDGLKKLATDSVSVRSSAMNEDGLEKSFAGQYDTFLNVSLGDVEKYIKLCWVSLYNESVTAYFSNGDLYGMNVIIEKMIDPDVAGVAFSIDPTSNTGNYIVIEATEGLGENLVSGKVTPTKFLIRREINKIDLKLGPLNLSPSVIEKLAETVLKIESVYGHPVDVEYAIVNEDIFILQARPITSECRAIIPYSLSITRPMSIIEEEIYHRGEYDGILSLTERLYYYKPLFVFDSEKETVNILYNDTDLEEDPSLIYDYLEIHFSKIKTYYESKILTDIEEIQKTLTTGNIDKIGRFIDRIVRIFPFISLGQLAGHFDDISDRVKEFLIDFRKRFDTIVHEATDFLVEELKKDLPDQYKNFIDYLTLDEALGDLPSIESLEKRKKGYIYFTKLYEMADYDTWFRENYITISTKQEEVSLKGNVAYSKNARGKVCIVYSEKDFNKFEEGDILVTPMTVPKFMDVIRRAGGIITDEGGVTCHASIIAREFKISCVVGCKNATKILKDGDEVEIDGATGEIIIK